MNLTKYQETIINTKLSEGEDLFIVTGMGMGTTYALINRALHRDVVKVVACNPYFPWATLKQQASEIYPELKSVERNYKIMFNYGRLALQEYAAVNIEGFKGEVYLDGVVSPTIYFELKNRYKEVSFVVKTNPEEFTTEYAPKLRGVYKILTWPWTINPMIEDSCPQYQEELKKTGCKHLVGEWV